MSTTMKVSYPHTPDYVTLLPPGEILSEKMFEMGVDAEALSVRCNLSAETIRSLMKAEIALTPEMAKELEKATWIPAKNWQRHEENYRKKLDLKK